MPAAVTETRGLRVALYEPSGRGGVCHYTYALAEHLVQAGADVTVMTTEGYELADLARSFRVDYVFRSSWWTRLRSRWRRPVVRATSASAGTKPAGTPARRGLLKRLRLRWLHGLAIARLLRRRTDVVHFQWLVDRRQDLAFMGWLERVGITVVLTAHDVEPHLTASARDRSELQKLYATVSRVVVHAEANKRELRSVFAVDPAKIAVIPHGSYDFLCPPGGGNRAAARERLGLPHTRVVILFFGLIKRYKGLEFLVEAFEQALTRARDAFLLIVGDIFAGDPESHGYYKDLVDGLQGRDDVRCVAEYVPVEDVGTYFAAADMVVLPYVRTYHSGVLHAAYAAGRPVIVTDTGGLPEVVEEGKSGLVVPTGDAKALAAALVALLSDPARRQAMGERAGELAATTYAWSIVASRTLDLYESAMSPHHREEQKGASVCL